MRGYYNNSATEKINGIEMEILPMRFRDNLSFQANYTHIFTQKDASGTWLYNRARDEVNGSLSYLYDEKTSANLSAKYISSRYSVGDKKVGGYSLYNLDIMRKITKDTTIGIHLKNLLNKEYQNVYGYNTEGRAVYLDVGVKF